MEPVAHIGLLGREGLDRVRLLGCDTNYDAEQLIRGRLQTRTLELLAFDTEPSALV